jgi:capsular exopolysaccharide synthesis family protein
LYVELAGVVATSGGTEFVQEEMNTLENEIRNLQAALADIQRKSRTDPTLQAAHMSELKKELSERRQLYSQLVGSYNTLTSIQVELLREAEVPKNPVGPGLRLAVAIGMLAGVVAVVGVIFFIEQTDDILRTPAKISQATGLSTLLTIEHLPAETTQTLLLNGYHKDTSNTVLRQPLLPRGKEASDGEINNTHPPHTARLVPATLKQVSVVATGHQIRAFSHPELPDVFLTLGVFFGGQRSQLTSNGSNFRSLLISSPQDNDGKTLIASRLALSLARIGVEVVLIDANLRKPGIHTIFGLSNDVGLSTLLISSQLLDASSALVLHTGEPNLAILPAGPALDLPNGVLSSARMRIILSELSQRAFVVIDGPAVLASSDAVILADKSDRILMVVNARHTAEAKLNQALEMLTRVNEGILGVVLNEANNL